MEIECGKYGETFFEAEERDGFWVRSMMKRVWALQMDLLQEIDKVCKKHGLTWYAEGGTLLGAVRHGGYIPWDDDIDIGMLRRDYELFKRYAAVELPNDIKLYNSRDEKQWDTVLHVYRGEKVLTDPQYLKTHYGCPYPVMLDIMVYDNVPDDPAEREAWQTMFKSIFTTAWATPYDMCYQASSQDARECVDLIEGITGRKIDRSKPMRSQLMNLLEYVAAMYMERETKQVCMVPHKEWVFEKAWFDERVELPFERITIQAPIGYEGYLKTLYGDYMTPVKGTAMHDYPCFGDLEKLLFAEYEKMGVPVPDLFRE